MNSSNNNLEQHIIDTARQLFIERGFTETSMSDIAGRVGINRPTLHYYFRTKERMFQAVFKDIVVTLRPKVEEIFSRDIPFNDCLKILLDEYETLFMRNPSIPRFIAGEISRDVKHLIEAARELELDKTFLLIARRMDEEMEAGRLRKVPMHIVFITFYSLLTFPLYSRKLLVELFLDDDSQFAAMLHEWKQYILFYLDNLLLPASFCTASTQDAQKNRIFATSKEAASDKSVHD